MTREDIRLRLIELRRSLEAPFVAARAAGNTAEMERLQAIAGDIDEVLDEIALASLATLAASLTDIKSRIEGRTGAVIEAGQDLGGMTVAELSDVIERLFEETSEEPLPEVQPTAGGEPAAGGPLPEEAEERAGQPDAAEPSLETAPPTTAGQPQPAPELTGTVTAPDPGEAAGGRLMLTEAHLLALWKRSQFPIDGRGIIVFGLRGCRPVDFSGTGFAPQHEIEMTPVNYRTMNCTLGQWRPGAGFALFPGSTVPFGATVEQAISAGGTGVNQLGRGRYAKYVANWHKRSEGPRGHWAMIQECPITLQRSSDDADYDLLDRWEVGRIAGDNIHCAFHMGVDGNIPHARFSSAGCQTVAGTVKKGVRDSSAGPWRTFIEPFEDRLGNQKSAEYVLFSAEEAQQIIRNRYAGKTVVLRFGSAGRLVEDLQAALNARRNAGLRVDGDFGPGTFQAVIDFQAAEFGEDADDGVVGAATAGRLGLHLPLFNFADAIAGGPGHAGPTVSSLPPTVPLGVAPADTGRPPAPAGTPLCWGLVTRQKHGDAFNEKVIAISNRLRCDPNHLMAVMAFETGASFDPAKKNAAGSGATGLIQFMPRTAEGLGTDTASLARMTAVDQLDFVERYLGSIARSRPLPTLSDLYMAVLWPAAVGKLESHVLFAKPSRTYDQNAGLDVNRDGVITKAEAAAKVQDKLEQGMRASRLG